MNPVVIWAALASLSAGTVGQDPPAASPGPVEATPAPQGQCGDAHMDIRDVSITCFVEGSGSGRPGAIYNAPVYGAPTGPEPIPMQAYSEPAEGPVHSTQGYSGSGYSGSGRSRPYSYSPGTYRPRTVHVRSYTRRDGTRVRAHTRSAPRRR